MKIKITLLFAILLAVNYSVFAQSQDTVPASALSGRTEIPVLKRNYVKVNLTSLLLKNYAVQYERVLTRKISAAISGRYMPSSAVPFKTLLIDKVADNDPDTEKILEQIKLSNYAITPEIKFYIGRGYGQGFYISLFYRYANYESGGIPIDFESDLGEDRTLDLSGSISSHTGGFLLGLQKNLGKSLSLDLWFMGPHIGNGKGTFTGKSSVPLSAEEQDQIRQSLQDIELPIVNTDIDVDSNGAVMRINGPWAGLRAGVTFGIRF